MGSRTTFASQVIMSVISAKLSLVSTIGNGSFLAIFARFKNLRNFPNILFANLAAVDFLNAIVDVPLFVLSYVWKTSWMKGKTWAIISSSLHLEFTVLNIVSMFALMLDRFLALYLDLKYFTWKTTAKAYGAVLLIWLVCTALVALSTIPLFYMDLDDPTIGESREKIFQHRKELIASIMVVFTSAATVLGILTSYTLHRKKKQRIQLNLAPLQAKARLEQDIRVTKTVAMAVATYFICYVPAVAYSISGYRNTAGNDKIQWPSFLTAICTFISSASNPIIYVLRNGRCRNAIRQLAKDPCGSSPFQERPAVTNGKDEKRQKNSREGEVEKMEGEAIRQPVADPFGCSVSQERPVKTIEEGEKQRHKDARCDAEQWEGGEHEASTRPEHNLESEARSPTCTASTQESQSKRVVTISCYDKKDGSVSKQACQNGLEAREEEEKDQVDGSPVESEGVNDTYL